MATNTSSTERLASGSGDGVIKAWDLVGRKKVWQTRAHDGIVKALCWTNSSKAAGTGAGAAMGQSGAAADAGVADVDGHDQRCCFN
jgi:WD40 repeat protein